MTDEGSSSIANQITLAQQCVDEASGAVRSLAQGSDTESTQSVAQFRPFPTTAPSTDFSKEQIAELLRYTVSLVQAAVTGTKLPQQLEASLEDSPGYGVFVTLKRGPILRACRGHWGDPNTTKLGALVRSAALSTATQDFRFPAITPFELPLLSFEISIMYNPQPIETSGRNRISSVAVGTHGLVISHAKGQGLLLPHVAAENGWDAETFLKRLAGKAGLPEAAWADEESRIMTFQTQLFKAEPTAGDFDPQKLPPPVLQQYISLVNLIIEQSQTEVNVHSSLAARVAQQIGLGIGNEAGVTATVFAAGSNLLELLKKGIESLSAACSEAKLPLGPITRLSFLTHPIPLRPADYPTRHASLIQFAVLAQQDQRTALTMPGARALPDRVASALESLKAPIEAWKSGAVSLVALRPFTIEIQPRDTAPQGRQPMCPGSFYPKSPNEIRSDLEKFLRCDSPTQKRQVRAVVLPHAGWRFCGDIIGKTLRQIEVPDRAIVLGPKHTPHGPNWSISASPAWLYPHTTVPIAPDLRKMLLEKISGLELDNEAHRIEHSIEVLLPFLQHLNPNIKVAPIALGRSSFSSLGSFAEALSEIIHGKDNPPLLVISSDMNHFASEEENQRLDHKALDALKTGDPQTLYSTCTENKISMCGMLPTVAALWALKLLSETLQIELIDYHTSYPISGDSSRVVGYAGVIIE